MIEMIILLLIVLWVLGLATANVFGGLINVLSCLTVKEVIDPGIAHTTQSCEDYLNLIDSKNI